MLRILGYLVVFVLGGGIGMIFGGLGGAASGSYLGACKVIDQAVASGAMTQDAANQTMSAIAVEIGVKPGDKARIMEALKSSNQAGTACATAIGSAASTNP